MNSKTALVFGSTGLVGNYLVDELVSSSAYSTIKLFVRKPVNRQHPQIAQHIIDFEDINASRGLITGTDLFICLGTTLKKAGSVENMDKIDRILPVQIAQIALENGVKNISVVSSIGAKMNSRNYYLRIKGTMEEEIMKLGFENICIARPSLLLGERKEKRVSETISKFVMKGIGFLFIGKVRRFRPIHGRTVALAMIKVMGEDLGKITIESDELHMLGSQ